MLYIIWEQHLVGFFMDILFVALELVLVTAGNRKV